jgi:hypothetical protein
VADSLMSAPPPEWDFSTKQWAKIVASMQCFERADGARIQEICAAGECPFFLEIVRSYLLKAVNRYLSHTEAPNRATMARIDAWCSVRRHAVALRKAIRALDDPRDRSLLKQIEEETKIKPDELRSFAQAAVTVTSALGQKGRLRSAIEREGPNRVLYRELFRIWMWMGGELTGPLGHRQIRNEPCGPLISFVKAVMEPALGKPVAAETIRSWIGEERKLQAELQAEGQPVGVRLVDPAFKEEFVRLELVEDMEIRKILEEHYGDLMSPTDLKRADRKRISEILHKRLEPHREAAIQRFLKVKI